jgi:hypothetical protein
MLLRKVKFKALFKDMKLNFPNVSRHYDGKRNRVQFWGYDGAIEVSFFVGADALQKLGRLNLEATDMEKHVLSIFDAARRHIEQVADKVYCAGRRGNYLHCLAPGDF